MGSFLLLSGKVHFGYIYIFSVLGYMGMNVLLDLVSKRALDFWLTCSAPLPFARRMPRRARRACKTLERVECDVLSPHHRVVHTLRHQMSELSQSVRGQVSVKPFLLLWIFLVI